MTIATDGSVDPARLKRFEESRHRFFQLIGARLTFISKDRVEAELPAAESICNQGGNLHGGAFMAFTDHVGAVATIVNLPQGTTTTTLESKANFFAPVMAGDTARAECTPLHRGRTTHVWETRVIRGDGRLAAIVMQTQMVMPKPQETK